LPYFDEIYYFCQTFFGVGVSDTALAFDYAKVDDLSFVIEYGLRDGHIIIGASQFDSNKSLSCKFEFIVIIFFKSGDKVNEWWYDDA